MTDTPFDICETIRVLETAALKDFRRHFDRYADADDPTAYGIADCTSPRGRIVCTLGYRSVRGSDRTAIRTDWYLDGRAVTKRGLVRALR